MIRRVWRWVASWFHRQTTLESLGTVDAHKQSKYGASREGDQDG